jgi:5-formyltetrahydrofolate cyclo-ligase
MVDVMLESFQAYQDGVREEKRRFRELIEARRQAVAADRSAGLSTSAIDELDRLLKETEEHKS